MDIVYGHQNIKKGLMHAAQIDRMHHALLFVGPDGVGKTTLARAFIKTLMCDKTDVKHGIFNTCGECENCKRMANAFKYFDSVKGDSYTPETADDGSVRLGKSIAAPSFPDYYEIDDPTTGIQVEVIRSLQEKQLKRQLKTHLKSASHRYVLIHDAQKLQPVGQQALAANCFLKTLEEPDPNTTFFLIAPNLNALLPTIISRCQLVRFAPFSDSEVSNWLMKNNNINQYEADTFATMSYGSIGTAQNFISDSDDNKEVLSRFQHKDADVQRIISVKTSLEALEVASAMKISTSTPGEKKKQLERVIAPTLRLLQLFLRDILTIQLDPTAEVSLKHHTDAIEKCAKSSKQAAVLAALDNVQEIYTAFCGNANEPIAWDRLLLGFQGVLFIK